ncbi:8-amino-7-oxononanoate synthase [Amycolatopsis xylanica]|uniref:8-amino-7-oxononanoate synthase n=1 Tax=Amycolatopsis xylanica TaxID=589385 RepID=A0A1H2WBB2_9PSEU|nr:aminotransferase class I/II-fold pyridoxal phosphate-dependent enzyme [Amycolatopsis xylanica]SDW77319.1 8-amino-7-oxononanoate synthase [Amycolatopsis xylanica]
MEAAYSARDRHDVAIVGMACRFPGARDVNDYWNLLKDPKPQFATVPHSRWRPESFAGDDQYSSCTDRMAALPDVGFFDAEHYGIPPRRARMMDPQHRLLVDLAREAIQDAGWEKSGFNRTDTSVIMGLSESGYREISAVNVRLRQLAGGEFGKAITEPGLAEAAAAIDGFHGSALSGVLLNMGPAAVSSVFDLHGESYALDSACSSGLASVANAVFALRDGRCEIALAGAAQLQLTPDLMVGLSRIGALSRTGECRPFDRRADGFVLGEGAGVLVLRRLADARAAGDRIYAVIRGIGLSNDGLVKGGMTPQATGQLLALRRAYTDADVSPGSVGYLEAHGTGTTVGDRVEIEALRALRADGAAEASFGAVKSIVGHSLNAAGIAGLIKTALVVHKGQIVPQPDYSAATGLGLDEAGLRIPREQAAWTGRRVAGVSAFGFGGTNAHLVLEQAPEQEHVLGEPTREVLVLSARDRAGLVRHAREVANALADERPPLRAVANTLAKRVLFEEQLAVTADSLPEAIEKLTAASVSLESGETPPAVPTPQPTDGPLCTLPPTPLRPKDYWIVDTTKQERPVPEAPADDVLSLVLEEVAGTSAFPVEDLDEGLRLVADLGLDSLLLAELDLRLRKRIPGVPDTADFSDRDLTIGELATLITGEPKRPAPPAAPMVQMADLPEVLALDERIDGYLRAGFSNPYFRIHDGIVGSKTVVDGKEYLSFSGYNYLGLAGHPAVAKAVCAAVERYGTSVSGSRVLSGERQLTLDLERALAGLLGTEDCVALVSGHATNVTTIGHLLGKEDLVVHDALAHDSILQGCALSGATRRPFAHNDLDALEHILRGTRDRFRRVLIAVEGAYSMDGDLVRLPGVIELKRKYGAMLMVDEAHSLGTVGRSGGGVGEFYGVDRSDVDLWMGTLSKSLASCGGYLAGSARLVRWLKYTLPGFSYSVGLTPANAAAALAAVELIGAEPWRLTGLRRNAELFLKLAKESGIDTGPAADSPIVPCVVGDSNRTLQLANTLFEQGILVDPILYPAVDEAQTRLRFFVTSEHTEREIEHAAAVLASSVRLVSARCDR